MRRLAVTLGLVLLLLPAISSAMQQSTWDFRAGGDAGEWDIQGFETPQQTENGILLKAGAEGGRLLRYTNLPHGIDAIRIVFSRSQPVEMMIVWHPRTAPRERSVQLPLKLQGGNPEVAEINLQNYPDWDPGTDVMGFAFPSGSEVQLAGIELMSWSPLEKLRYGFQSFWTFDNFRVYSINFLWGPLLTFNPIGISQLYSTQPPFGWSGGRLFYAVLMLAIAWIGIRRFIFKEMDMRRHARTFAVVFLALWFFFDFRMGLETMSYAVDDVTSYVLPPPGKKVLRNYENFYDSAERSLPALREHPRFMFLGPSGTPFTQIVRYLAYPSTPLFESEDLSLAKVWFVFRRPDAIVDDQGRLAIGGRIATPPGEILEKFDEHSFLFRIL